MKTPLLVGFVYLLSAYFTQSNDRFGPSILLTDLSFISYELFRTRNDHDRRDATRKERLLLGFVFIFHVTCSSLSPHFSISNNFLHYWFHIF